MNQDLLGYLPATLTTVAFLPQVIKVWRTRCVRDISLPMYATFVLGVALWIVYGVAIRSAPVVCANAVTLVLSSAVLVAKVRFGDRG